MKRILLLASFLGLLGFSLYAQNGDSAGKGADNQVNGGARIINGGQNTGIVNKPNTLPGSHGPNAQVTVTPGPQGLPTVNSSASAWPLGPALEENLNFWLNGVPQTLGNDGEDQSSQAQNSQPRTTGQSRPSFEPPPMGGLPSLGAPRSGGRSSASMGPDLVTPSPQVRRDLQNSPAREEVPAGETPQSQAQNRAPPQQEAPVQAASQSPPQNGRSNAQVSQAPGQNRQTTQRQTTPPTQPAAPAKKVVVVPSPVHYDRAGRRVIDPSWQETMYQIIQAEKQAASPLEQAGTEQDGLAVEQSGAPNGEAAGKAPVVRETVIVVPGPTVWRIRGTLTVAKGMLALEDDEGILWYLPGLDCYIGFIDGLDAGEEAALEGYAPPRGSSQERYFQPIRLFIDEMAYDLSIPPYGIAMPAQGPGGQTIIIRENNDREDWDQDDLDDWDDDLRDRGERPRSNSPKPQPAWQHNHKSPWAPPTSVLDFEMDYDSLWRDDPAKQERRERDSREIWY